MVLKMQYLDEMCKLNISGVKVPALQNAQLWFFMECIYCTHVPFCSCFYRVCIYCTHILFANAFRKKKKNIHKSLNLNLINYDKIERKSLIRYYLLIDMTCGTAPQCIVIYVLIIHGKKNKRKYDLKIFLQIFYLINITFLLLLMMMSLKVL